jgi:FkbM family methyltransferase
VNTSESLSKIKKIVLEEGVFAFTARIARLGRYRLAIRKALNKKRLAADHVEVCGQRLDLPGRRSGIVEELLLYGTHEPVATRSYSQQLRPGMNVLEVGTNLGYYLAIAADRIGGSGKIIGFEPDPELFQIASKNSTRLKTPTRVCQLAASDRNGTATFYQSEVGNWGSLKNEKSLQQTSSVNVEVRSIADFCDEAEFKPDALRMDIEGAEAMALSGARRMIERCKPLLFIEVHRFMLSETEYRSILSIIKDAGYRKITTIDRYYDWPWCLESARRRCIQEMEMREFEAYFLSPHRAAVFSVIASA